MSENGDKPWPLPTSWLWTTIGEVADVIGGSTPATSDPNNFIGSIPWITPADMSTHVGKQIARGARFISEKGLANSGARWLPKGTVLFSSRAPIGYVAVASQPLTTNQGFKSFVAAQGVSPDFIYYWLTSAKNLAEKLASGTTFLEISGAKAALIPFPVVPAAEQTRIVEKLEELLSDLDAGVAELKAAQKKLAQYRLALLKAAVEGALTAEWRKKNKVQETGTQLLDRILAERRQRWEEKQLAKFKEQGKTPPKGWQDKYSEPVKPETSNLPELPQGWVWASVDQCSAYESAAITDGPFGSNLKSAHYTESGPRVIRLKNIGEGFFVDAKAHISEDHYQSLKKHAVEAEDVVVAMLGEDLPRACLIPEGVAPGIVKADCARIRVNRDVLLPDFLTACLNSRNTKQRVASLIKGIGRPRINLQHIRGICIPLPSFAEQTQIVSVITGAFDEVSQQLEAIQLSLKQSAAQRKNILKSAFSGQLVPQDPTDEPASVLLERIRAERAARATNGKRGWIKNKDNDNPRVKIKTGGKP